MPAFKAAVKSALPDPAVQRLQRYLAKRARLRDQKTRPIDLSRAELIREASLEQLRDPSFLEHDLLPRLGLNDELLHQIPPQLHPHAGHGLFHWQLPNQFSKYLVELSRHTVESYLEIGSRHGGTFVITVEYLNRFHPVRKAVATDLGRSKTMERYAAEREGVTVLQADSHSDEFGAFVDANGPFDLVLVDGDHSEEGCRRDFELVEDRARIVVLHDIVSDDVPGVGAVWRWLKKTRAGRYRFHEFVDRYPDPERTGVSGFGLGLAIRPS